MFKINFGIKIFLRIIALTLLICIITSCSFIKNTPEPTIKDHPNTLPPGSYQEYCKYCQLEWPYMQCSCLDETTETLVFSSIDVSECTKEGLEIKCHQGQLVCKSKIQ